MGRFELSMERRRVMETEQNSQWEAYVERAKKAGVPEGGEAMPTAHTSSAPADFSTKVLSGDDDS